jgi:hypothetical protein
VTSVVWFSNFSKKEPAGIWTLDVAFVLKETQRALGSKTWNHGSPTDQGTCQKTYPEPLVIY